MIRVTDRRLYRLKTEIAEPNWAEEAILRKGTLFSLRVETSHGDWFSTILLSENRKGRFEIDCANLSIEQIKELDPPKHQRTLPYIKQLLLMQRMILSSERIKVPSTITEELLLNGIIAPEDGPRLFGLLKQLESDGRLTSLGFSQAMDKQNEALASTERNLALEEAVAARRNHLDGLLPSFLPESG